MGKPLAVVMFAKEPRMGWVKTRLGRDIGRVAATSFYRHATRQVIQRLKRDRRFRLWLALAPDGAVHTRMWPSGPTRIPQGRGDLGQRMQRMMDRVGCGPLAIIGSDIPDISADDLARAGRLLGGQDAVFGRADDGGYWLVGQRRCPKPLAMFARVRWSGADTLSDTLANIPRARVGYLPERIDVDDGPAYRLIRHRVGRLIRPATAR